MDSQANQGLVICVGNDLMGDDAAGLAVYRRLKAEPLPPGVRVEFAGLAGLSLLDRMLGEPKLVMVDAVQFGAKPGTVHVIDWRDLPETGSHAVSAHGIGLRETVELARLLYPSRAPRRAVLVGIEGSCFDEVGRGMSDSVSSGIHRATEAVKRELVSGRRRKGMR